MEMILGDKGSWCQLRCPVSRSLGQIRLNRHWLWILSSTIWIAQKKRRTIRYLLLIYNRQLLTTLNYPTPIRKGWELFPRLRTMVETQCWPCKWIKSQPSFLALTRRRSNFSRSYRSPIDWSVSYEVRSKCSSKNKTKIKPKIKKCKKKYGSYSKN